MTGYKTKGAAEKAAKKLGGNVTVIEVRGTFWALMPITRLVWGPYGQVMKAEKLLGAA